MNQTLRSWRRLRVSVGIRLAMKCDPLRPLHEEVRVTLEQGAVVAIPVAPNPMKRGKYLKDQKVKWLLERLKGIEQVSIQAASRKI